MYEEENIEPDFLRRPKENPFRTPDLYFDSLEEKIMGKLVSRKKENNSSAKIIKILKPALSIAASFALIYILIYYPVNTFLNKNIAKNTITDSAFTDWLDIYSVSLTTIDESTLVSTILSDEANNITETNPDEVLAYLSTGLNDLEIYSEIQN